ncbi:beta-galactosidase GalB [Polaribacter sp. BAL334]|uniref:beta-galactosidase GalB n=1 Tax=Polaribacter sp. BAL334 TaxID=1708178 RepID=UPI0018D21A23|nr:beta-galactosidase GalB [Polaribacter sp. BAL334]
MKKIVYNLIFISVFSTMAMYAQVGKKQAQPNPETIRERISINNDWLFQKDDPAEVAGSLDYSKIRDWVLPSSAAFLKNPSVLPKRPEGNLGNKVPYTHVSFDDSAWRKLNLPHDWAIEGPFEQEYRGRTGKLKYSGAVWYRKHINIPASDAGRHIYLDIDGAMSYATVWCNGKFVGGWPYGYSSFRLDLTPYVKLGSDNVLSIRLDNPDNNSRWYPGAGIYRNVWLVKTNPVHIGQWGTFITTPKVSTEEATVAVQVTVDNKGTKPTQALIKTQLLFADKLVKELPIRKLDIPSSGSAVLVTDIAVTKPQLWDTTTPNLYTAVTTVDVGGVVVDKYETVFGIRSIAFTPDNGFLLNGNRVQINGVCNHHDLGALGTAFNTRAAERQLEILKEMGVNALRTAHNPPAPELLELCDAMGILVMNEAYDSWKGSKVKNGYSELFDDWHEQDLRALLRRDRNNPSVIMWSMGNEVKELTDSVVGPAIGARLTAIAHDEDPTRPTTLGSNKPEASYNGIQKSVDVMGQNYQRGDYAEFRIKNPTIPLVASETTSAVSSRGEYFFQTKEQFAAQNAANNKDGKRGGKKPAITQSFEVVSSVKTDGRANFQISSYDLYGPAWVILPDDEFATLEKNPHVAGQFVWTGFDYIGEPTPYNADSSNLLNFTDPKERSKMEKEMKELSKIKVPSRSSYFGIVDLAGFKKDRFYLYQAHWRPDFPMAHLLPHWSWPEREGQLVPVHLYTTGDEAELFLNGKSLGRKKKKQYEYRLRWDNVTYTPGELKAVAYKNGKPWASEIIKTAGPATALVLEADRSLIESDKKDLSFVTVTISDKNGILVPRSKNLVSFTVSGPGEIVATDNGDATSHSSFQSPNIKAYNGLALAIIRATGPGKIIVTAKAEGLVDAKVEIIGQ